MKDFKLCLDKKYENIENDIIKYNKENTKNGNLKIDIENFKKLFDLIEICNFKKEEEEEPEGVPSLPPEIIEENYLNRKNTFDALGISKKDQQLFFDKCEGNFGKVLYIAFKLFMQYGTNKETFYNKLLEKPSYGLSINPLNYFMKSGNN